jgi:hypothetical protein
MVKRIVGGFFLTLILLWLFAPKQELYYLLEKSLKKRNIVISNEVFQDKWYGLKITNANIYVSGVKMAEMADLDFNFFLLYNTLTIHSVAIDSSFTNIAPKNIDKLLAKYSIIKPLKIELDGEGSFGVLKGEVDLLNSKVEVLFPVPKDLKSVKKFLKKDPKKGWYYETNY